MGNSQINIPLLNNTLLPVDIVLAPEWWHVHGGIDFDRDFFFHPARRLEEEQKMERILHERWGQYGLGSSHREQRPEIGAVHLAAGYIISEMCGCEVKYEEAHPPKVVCAGESKLEVDPEKAFSSTVFKDFHHLLEQLKNRHGRVLGDINWGGILNVALDLRGQELFLDMMTQPEAIQQGFQSIGAVIERFVTLVQQETGSSSISVNRNVRHLEQPVFLHSECSHTMISEMDYEQFLMPFDIRWSKQHRPFGIHYCGNDPHRYANAFSKLPHLDFLDVGWGGDVAALRKYLPDTFLNIRLSPVEIVGQGESEIQDNITRLVAASGNPWLTGVCCINMDDQVGDDKISLIFETVEELRKQYQ